MALRGLLDQILNKYLVSHKAITLLIISISRVIFSVINSKLIFFGQITEL